VRALEGVDRDRGEPLERGDRGVVVAGALRGDRLDARAVKLGRRGLLGELGDAEQDGHDRRRDRRLLGLARHD